MNNGLEKNLLKEEKVSKCLVPAKTMLAMPGTRQMITNQEIWKYIYQKIKILLAARLSI